MSVRVDLHRWDADVNALVDAMDRNPPPHECILLYGSSTMTNWRQNNLCYDQLAPLPIVNHGFGGSTADDALYQYHRLVAPVRPYIMVYYEGANDLNCGGTPTQVFDATQRLFDWARQDLPGIQFVIIPIKLSPALAAVRYSCMVCNDLFSHYASENPDTHIIDVRPVDFDENGLRRNDVYIEDQLHHTVRGYEILTAQLKPALERLYAARKVS